MSWTYWIVANILRHRLAVKTWCVFGAGPLAFAPPRARSDRVSSTARQSYILDACMKLLTRHRSSGLSASLCLARDAASTPAPKRASLLVRLPYYIFLACMAAVYYEYAISLNLRWLIINQGYVLLPLVFLAVFHFLFGMFMWSLLVTVYRGPGAVGEVLVTSKPGSSDDLEAGIASEAAPLMQDVQDASANIQSSGEALLQNGTAHSQGGSKWLHRTASASRSHTSSDEEQDSANSDYLELQPKVDYGDSSDEDDEDHSSANAKPGDTSSKRSHRKKKEIKIIYPGTISGSNLSSVMAKANGKARFCRKCKLSKPDRSHHCSTCGFCVLKMDHHCPWIGGCVGFKNYKPFILFLFYGDLTAIFVCATSFWMLIQVLDMDIEDLGLAPVGWGFLVLFGFLFSVMLTGFFPYHLYLAMNNRSTIENMERNGRLLSLPARAETMLSAGVPDPHTAGLPERTKSGMGQHLMARRDGDALPPPPGFEDSSSSSSHHRAQQQNPFLPTSTLSTSHTNVTAFSSLQPQTQSSNPYERSSRSSMNAISSLTRMSKRELERKAGRINIYDLGTWQANFKETFGSEWNSLIAWIPVGKSAGSGYEWPINKNSYDKLQEINYQLRMPHAGI